MESKYKHEDIVHVQNTLWAAYKDFLADKDMGRHKAQTDALINECQGQIKVFAYNLVSVWNPVVESLSADFRNGKDTELRIAEIWHIQKTIWEIYKEFRESHSVKEWTRQANLLVQKYNSKEIQEHCSFFLISWIPVIVGLNEEFKKGGDES